MKGKPDGRITRIFEVSVDEAVHFIRVDGYWSCGSHQWEAYVQKTPDMPRLDRVRCGRGPYSKPETRAGITDSLTVPCVGESPC